MYYEIEGELLEVQGCIERALDIIESHDWKFLRGETAVTREYSFSQTELGDVGKVKISVLRKEWTELNSYYASLPDEKWMMQYLPKHILWPSMSNSLHNLLAVYTWQVENNLFNLTSTELYKLGYSNTPVDWGWGKFGLDDLDIRKQAEQEFKAWRDKVHELKKKELGKIIDVIVAEMRSDGFSIIVFDGVSREGKRLRAESIGAAPAAEKVVLKRKDRGAQLKTTESLKRLREIRLNAINNNSPIPKKVAAMNQAGITDKTWKKYDRELWARWDDKTYNQEKQE